MTQPAQYWTRPEVQRLALMQKAIVRRRGARVVASWIKERKAA